MKKGEKKMKKNIEWLKKEIATEMIRLESNRAERWSDVKYQTLRSVAQKIDQLDEPEVLSQEESINIVLDDLKEYIKEQQSLSQNVGLAHTSAGNDTHYRQYDYVLECINEYEPSDELQNLLVPKQEVLSQEWVDSNSVNASHDGMTEEYVHVDDLQNLIVPTISEMETVDITEGQIMDWLDDNEFYHHATAETVLANAVDKGELGYYGTKYSVVKKPVIPKYVADWITKHRDTFDLYPMLKRLEKNSSKLELTYKWYRTNTHDFVNAYLTGEYKVEEEPLYYALAKGHELTDGDKVYWVHDKNNEDMFIGILHSPSVYFLSEMSKSDWNELGINDSNADFVKVGEVK